MHFFAVMAQKKEPGRSTAHDGQHRDRGDDQFEFALGAGDSFFRSFRAAFCLVIVCHCPPGPDWK